MTQEYAHKLTTNSSAEKKVDVLIESTKDTKKDTNNKSRSIFDDFKQLHEQLSKLIIIPCPNCGFMVRHPLELPNTCGQCGAALKASSRRSSNATTPTTSRTNTPLSTPRLIPSSPFLFQNMMATSAIQSITSSPSSANKETNISPALTPLILPRSIISSQPKN